MVRAIQRFLLAVFLGERSSRLCPNYPYLELFLVKGGGEKSPTLTKRILDYSTPYTKCVLQILTFSKLQK